MFARCKHAESRLKQLNILLCLLEAGLRVQASLCAPDLPGSTLYVIPLTPSKARC